MNKLLDLVQKELEKWRQLNEKVTSQSLAEHKLEMEKHAINNHAAFQELYELTQRKFLKQLIQYCDKMQQTTSTTSALKTMPRLFCIDFVDKKDTTVCIVPMCECEDGFHCSDDYLPLLTVGAGNKSNQLFYPYLARIMNILKNGNLFTQLFMFNMSEGQKLINEIDKYASSIDPESANPDSVCDSYQSLRKYFVQEYENKNLFSWTTKQVISTSNEMDLQRCMLNNGKILWLCKKHVDSLSNVNGARVMIEDSVQYQPSTLDLLANKMLDEIASIDLDVL
jgi:hypothetical protein